MDEETTDEIQQVRQEALQHTRRDAYFWLIMILTSTLSAGGAIMVSVINTDRSERKLCAVVTTTDDAYHRMPQANLSPIGRLQAANFTRLRKQLGCEPYKEGN